MNQKAETRNLLGYNRAGDEAAGGDFDQRGHLAGAFWLCEGASGAEGAAGGLVHGARYSYGEVKRTNQRSDGS